MSTFIYHDPKTGLSVSTYCGPEKDVPEKSRIRKRFQVAVNGGIITMHIEQMESLRFFFENTGAFETAAEIEL
jgi:hypothetical protein